MELRAAIGVYIQIAKSGTAAVADSRAVPVSFAFGGAEWRTQQSEHVGANMIRFRTRLAAGGYWIRTVSPDMCSGPAWVVLSGWPTRIEAGGGIDDFADRSNQGAAKDRVRRGV